MLMKHKKNLKRRILKRLGNVGMAVVAFALATPSSSAIDSANAANEVIGSEGGQKITKEALDAALKMARSKPAMSAATTIVCAACIPAAGAAASPTLCIACGILIAKTLG